MKALIEYSKFPEYIKALLPFNVYWKLEHYRFLERFYDKLGFKDYALKFKVKAKILLDLYEVEYNEGK